MVVFLETASPVSAGGCRYGLTHDDLAGGEVADAQGSLRVVGVNAEYIALGPASRQLVLGFGWPQISDGSKRNEVIEHGPVSDPEFVWGNTRIEGG